MKHLSSPCFRQAGLALALAASLTGTPALAAPDEIQVYTDDINEPGEMGLEIHTNYVTRGRDSAFYDGERPPNHVLRVTPEFSVGLAKGWDAGFYLPMAWAAGGGATLDGVKARIKRLEKNGTEEDALYYGVNLEVGYSQLRIAEHRWNAELRGILGMEKGGWQLTANPILGWDVSGGGKVPDVDLALKLSRKVGAGYAFGVEHYAELGAADHLHAWRESAQSTFLVMEYEGKGWDINLGIGHGWTEPADKTTIKAIFGIPFK
ncbi:MAG: hypothetical protein KGZ83_01555 [Sulfuricella sp.]|nr:hypothetical protein [Sulfuricella sp.]